MSGKETAGSVSSAASSLKGKKPDIIKTAPHPDISGDTDRVSEMVLQLVKALGDATGILPELKALTSVRDENEALLRQMEEHQRGTDERERALQAEIEAKNALLFKFGKEWVEAVRNDAIIEHTSAELLKQRELEVIAAVKEKEAVIENILRDKDVEISDILKEKELEIADILKEKQLEIAEIVKEKELEVAELAERHEEAMENVKSTLEEAAAQHIEAAEKKLVGVKMERDDAVGEVEKRQAKIDELTEALSTTKARLKSETLDRRELENILETTNSQMGLRELDEEDL